MAWAVTLVGCHSWRSILRAARDWASPAGLVGMSLLATRAAHSARQLFAQFAQADV